MQNKNKSHMETLSRFYNYKCLNTEWYTNFKLIKLIFDSYCQWLTFFFSNLYHVLCLFRAYPIDEYPARSRQAAAIMLMIMNNLDPRVAQVSSYITFKMVLLFQNGSIVMVTLDCTLIIQRSNPDHLNKLSMGKIFLFHTKPPTTQNYTCK